MLALESTHGATERSQQAATFKSSAELVLIDTVVTDSRGRPVVGLGPEDFLVTLDDSPASVRAVDRLQFGGGRHEASDSDRASDGEVSDAGGRVVMLVVDDLSLTAQQTPTLLTAAQRTIEQWGSSDLIGMITTSGSGGAVAPTRDRTLVTNALRARTIVGKRDEPLPHLLITTQEAIQIHHGAPSDTFAAVVARECGPELGGAPGRTGRAMPLAALSGQATANDECAVRVRSIARMLAQGALRRAEQQMAAYVRIFKSLIAAPRPRIVLLLTGGVALNEREGMKGHLDELSRAAAESGVQVFALVEADDDGLQDRSPAQARARERNRDYMVSAAHTASGAAGGQAFRVVGQADRLFQRVVDQTSLVYRLGVEPRSAMGSRYPTVTVTIANRPGLTVSTRRQVMVDAIEPSTPTGPDSEALLVRLQQGGTSTGVPFHVGTATRRTPGDASTLQLLVDAEVPNYVQPTVSAMFLLLDHRGTVIRSGKAEMPSVADGERRIGLAVPITPETSTLRFAVGDAAGNIGSIETPVRAQLHRFGELETSDLLLQRRGDALQVAIEIYLDKPLPGGGITTHFAASPNETSGRAYEASMALADGEEALTYFASLSPGTLTKGRYTFRVRLLMQGAEPVEIARQVEILR